MSESKELAVSSQDYWGETNLDKSDFAIPRVRIGQPTSDGEAGKFLFNNGMAVESLVGIKLIVPRKTRVLYHGRNRARCKSDDFFSPSSFVSNPISSNCMSCPASQWGESDFKAQLASELGVREVEKPLCTETYNLLCADLDWNLFFISFQKSQLSIVKEKLFSRLKSFGKPAFEIQFDMKLVLNQGAGRKWYSVVFDNFLPASGADKGRVLWAEYSKVAQSILSEQHEAMDKEKDVSPPEYTAPWPEDIDPSENLPF
jgi:hypothetical protein